MDTLEKLTKLAKRQENEKAKIEGRLESLYEELEELGYDTLELAEKDVSVLQKKLEKMKSTFSKKLKELEKKYAHEL